MTHRATWLRLAAGFVAIAAGCRGPAPGPTIDPSPKAAPGPKAPPDVQTPNDPLHPRIQLETTQGNMLVELDAENAPATVLNFIQYVHDRYYDGTVFHRIIKNSMIHGGGHTPDLVEKTRGLRPAVQGSWRSGLKNERGTIAMLRGKGPGGGGTAQFYINVVDNPRLDEPDLQGAYAVFGRVVDGWETVEKISTVALATHPSYAEGRSAVVPIESVVIKSIRLVGVFDSMEVQAAAAEILAARQRRAQPLKQQIEKDSGHKAVTTPSGTWYVDFVIGQGPPVMPTDTIEFNYRGTLLDGTVFESTYEAGPVERQVGKFITGLQEGLAGINEGGKRTVVVPPAAGFGDSGIPGKVPPDATLIYEVEVLEIK